MTVRSLLTLVLCSTASTICAGDGIRVTVFDADGHETNGTLRSISQEAVTIDGEQSASWRWSDIVSLRFGESKAVPHEPRGSAIWMANGDRLIARPSGIEDEQLRATWCRYTDWPELSLPLESVLGFSLSLPHARERCDQIAAWLFERAEKRDELRLLNGDLLSGEVTGWREGLIRIKSGAELKLPSAELRDVAFNPELIALPETKELCWLISLRDGSHATLSASKSRTEHETLKAEHVSGLSFEIPLSAIFEWRVLRGRAVYLSDLTPISMKHVPFLPGSRGWPLQRDRSVAGGPLRLKGREFPKGLGMHSRSTVTYELGGRFTVFHAILGLDDTTVGDGTVTCLVEADGRRVFEEPALSRQKGAVKLPLINVAGTTRLTLLVDYGDLGDSQDHVNWADAVLLK